MKTDHTAARALAGVMRDALALDVKRLAHATRTDTAAQYARNTAKRRPIRQRRAATAIALARFDAKIPRTIGELGVNGAAIGLATLLRWGYLKKTPKGYLRTAKPFKP